MAYQTQEGMYTVGDLGDLTTTFQKARDVAAKYWYLSVPVAVLAVWKGYKYWQGKRAMAGFHGFGKSCGC